MKFKSTLGITIAVFAIGIASSSTFAADVDPGKHFHPKGNMPSKYTIEKQKALRTSLPLSDKKDFEEQKKGFIAAPEYREIMAEAGHVAWSIGKYDFLLDGKDFDSIHTNAQEVEGHHDTDHSSAD